MTEGRDFNGDRLKFARIYRGKTIIQLADEVEVTKQAISQYEKGINTPGFETLMKLINKLGFPRDFFFEKKQENIKVGNSYFRALLGTTKQEKQFQLSRIELLSDIFYFLEEYVNFPVLKIPEFEADDTIEQKASKLREFWGVGNNPIKSVVNLMEKNGICITCLPTQEISIDAFTQTQLYNGKKYYFTVLGDDKYSSARRQFSAAHELGHIILHENIVDTDEIDKTEYKKMEEEANQFASAFLLPREEYMNDLIYPNKLDYYIELKKKWRVSIAALIVRAYQLQAINVNQYQYLMKQINARGWKKLEPLDDMVPLAKPMALKKAVDVLINNQIFDEDSFMIALGQTQVSLNKQEVEILLGLEKGRLASKQNKGIVIELKSKGKEQNVLNN